MAAEIDKQRIEGELGVEVELLETAPRRGRGHHSLELN